MTEEYKIVKEDFGVIKIFKIDEDELHSFNDQPACYDHLGNKEWYKDNLLHREGDKPAIIITNGFKMYYKNGIKTRIGKPAVIFPNGKVEYWLEGVKYDKEDYFLLLRKRNISIF